MSIKLAQTALKNLDLYNGEIDGINGNQATIANNL